jgi:predicted RNase H-like nuclease (RuvC/YqgF family)
MDRELTDAELKASVAAMPARPEPDFLRPTFPNTQHEPPTRTMPLETFKSALLKRRLAEINYWDSARIKGERIVSKTTIAKEIKAIKHELRGTTARATAAMMANRHREVAEEVRAARADAERARQRVRALREELEEETKDIEKTLKEEREERATTLKENQKKRDERKAVVEAELERHASKRHKLVTSLKSVIAEQSEVKKTLEASGEDAGTPKKTPQGPGAPSPGPPIGWGRR